MALAAAATVVLAGCAGPVGDPAPADPGAAGPAAGSPPATAPAPGGAAGGSAGTPPEATAPAPGGPSAPEPEVLALGVRGPAVQALQQRLAGLGFWLGQPDGSYGPLTRHAVVAFQKAGGLATDGVAGPRTRQLLETAQRPTPRSDQGRVIEVDLDRQLLLVTVDGRVEQVLDASTGEVPGTTPPGRYEVFRHVDDYDPGPLGTLYRPKYFYQGVAVHGYPEVPPYPASHGCVRVTNPAMDWLWDSGHLAIGQTVWVYSPHRPPCASVPVVYARRRRPVPEVDAEPGLVVEDPDSGFCGAVVGFESGAVVLEDRHGKLRHFPLAPSGFLLDGRPVTLRRPAPMAAAPVPRQTASGSMAVAGIRARVARASRIWVEGSTTPRWWSGSGATTCGSRAWWWSRWTASRTSRPRWPGSAPDRSGDSGCWSTTWWPGRRRAGSSPGSRLRTCWSPATRTWTSGRRSSRSGSGSGPGRRFRAGSPGRKGCAGRSGCPTRPPCGG